MAKTLDELRENIRAAVRPGFRAKLLARGQSRAMIWRKGVLPEDSPRFGSTLTDDLLSYGYSLLAHGLRFSELGGELEVSRSAFEVAAEAIEAVAAKGEMNRERDFNRLVAAAAFHLGQFSARAYSLLHGAASESNLSPMERCLAKLILRDLNGLDRDIATWFRTGAGTDGAVIAAFDADARELGTEQSTPGRLGGMSIAIEGNYMAALAAATLGLERGEVPLIERAVARLKSGVEVSSELNEVNAWWCQRLAMHLIRGLWETSFHSVLPKAGPAVEQREWEQLKRIFITSLYRRNKAEIELWPSQVDAAKRVLDVDANLVLSLPTSAGKTRIAELCILACLSMGRRIVFVTPLRALSAQTEIGLRKTFGPLGKSVSSLYGSIGAHGADVDALSQRDIVVATPEKLDFALRSQPSLLDDVGLVVLDEGHMIGLEEREVRYEAQIQRLLRRSDAASRRIVCLSAILPDGSQLEDFSAWLTRDRLDGLIKNSWRPTRLRFGEVEWKGDNAQLTISVGGEKPFVPRFIVEKFPTKGRARKAFPSNQNELCIATAWRLVDDGQTVLVFCPLRKSVQPFASCIVNMHERGHIQSVLTQPESMLSTALSIGEEWFGSGHDILKCLTLGVAVHHGTLPTPYRKEVERLLRDGVLKVTVSSPTLAQGLNLAATCLVFQGLMRDRELIPISEFRNVIGRAGRAYVDLEGLVLYPIFDKPLKRRADWDELITSEKGREMESGILRLILTLLDRMRKKIGATNVEELFEYVVGQSAWAFPELPGDDQEGVAKARGKWETHLMSLDTAIFSLLEDGDVPDSQIEEKLDEVLSSSLFSRRLARLEDEGWKIALKRGVVERARYIWRNSTANQRRGYFLAGVGLETGRRLDNEAHELERLLLAANVGIAMGDESLALDSIEAFAEIAFTIQPFAPRRLPENWKSILRQWLLGAPISEIQAGGDEVVAFIENGLIYSLPWAMEAVRVRAAAHDAGEDSSDESMVSLGEIGNANAVLALETGTLSVQAAILIQSGFSFRLAAIKAVDDADASFESVRGMKYWLESPEVAVLTWNPEWPSVETHQHWVNFVNQEGATTNKPWSIQSFTGKVRWFSAPMPPGAALRLAVGGNGQWTVFNAEYTAVGSLQGWAPNISAEGAFVATANGEMERFSFDYIGPDDMLKTAQ